MNAGTLGVRIQREVGLAKRSVSVNGSDIRRALSADIGSFLVASSLCVGWIFHRSMATILAWPRSAEMSCATVEAARNTSDAAEQPPRLV
jgi:hypothetical protein